MAVQAGTGFSSALSTADYSSGIDCSGLEVSRKSAPRRGHLEVPPHNILCLRASDPFSVLHKNRRLLSDPWAEPFFTMLNTLRLCLPASAVLENIHGIRIVLD